MSDEYIKPEHRSDPNEPFWDRWGRDLEREIRKLIREEIRSWIIERNRRAFEHDSSKSIGQVTAVLEDERGIDFDVDFNEVRFLREERMQDIFDKYPSILEHEQKDR